METMNHEYYVSSEIAKLLEKAGFDWKCRKCYNKGVLFDMEPDEIRTQTPQHSSYDVLAPTLDVAQRWLREEKNLILLIDMAPSYCNGKPMGYKFVIHVSCGNHIFGEWKDTYEEALEAGIKKALEIILEKGE